MRILIAFLIVLVGTVVLGVSTYTSKYDTFATFEAGIDASDKDSENALSSHTLSVMEMAQVPAKYAEDFKNTVTAGIKARSEKDGNLAMKFLTEHNIPLDSKLYADLQAQMKAGRDAFKNSQTAKLDICKDYKTSLTTFWGSTFANFTGFPKLDLDQVCKVVSDAQTHEAFQTGIATKVKI